MDKLSLQYLETITFRKSIDMEELLIRKCRESGNTVKDQGLKDIISDFEKTCYEHIKMIKDKMIKLNIHG